MTGPSDPSIALLRWCAGHFRRPFSEHALRARLPQDIDLGDAAGLIRALAMLGLRAETRRLAPSRLDPALVPVIIWQKGARPWVLTALDPKTGQARVLDPAGSGVERSMPLAELSTRVEREVLVLTPDDAAGACAIEAPPHWFWSAVRACRGAWVQVVVASLLMNLLALALPLFVMNVYDKVIPTLSFVTLWTLTIGVVIALGLDLLLRLLRHRVLDTIGRRVDMAAGAALFRHALGVGLMDRPDGAGGMSSHLGDYEPVRDFFASASFIAFVDMIFIGVFIAVMFVIVGPLAWVPLTAVVAVLALAMASRLPMRRAADGVIQLASRRNRVKAEALDGAETVKTLGAEPAMQRQWEDVLAASARVNGRSRFWAHVAATGAQSATQIVSVCIIVWGVMLIFQGQITLGALIAANILAGRALAPLSVIAQTIFRAEHAIRALRALNRIMEIPSDHAKAPRSDLQVSRGAVTLHGVSVTYPGAPEPSLSDLDLTVNPGECIALLGRVGAGKSTLGRVMTGLIPVTEGMVEVDGFALGQYDPAELRRAIGYLPQRSDLFTGTLGDNLRLGAPHATQQEITRALSLSGLAEFVARAPQGLDLPVGERGGALSGGQAQALGLARLVLRRPKLLFLDEPTNAMDAEMERGLITGLSALREDGVTLILSTHRQSLVGFADRVVVLERGRKTLDGPRERMANTLTRVRGGQG